MVCNSCGCQLEDNDRFCPACGAKVEPEHTAVYQPSAPTREYHTGATREYAPVDSGVAANTADDASDSRTMVIDGGRSPYYQEEFAEPINPRRSYPPEYYDRQPQKPQAYRDSFDSMAHEDPDEEDDAYAPSGRRRYRTTTAGRRAVSILMCLMMLLFGFFAMLIGSLRLSLKEDNIRSACQKGTLADLKITTEKGEQTLGQALTDSAVDANTNLPVPLDSKTVDAYLRTATVNNFIENLAVDFTRFFIFGKAPRLLNSTEIVKFLKSVSSEMESQLGYAMSDADIDMIGKRIDGGDLSFLSVDENGGYFRQKYGINPYTISSLFSLLGLAVCGALTLLCIIMIFVINSGNLPAGLSFNGTTMIIFGIVNTLLAAGALILSYLRNIYVLSDLLRSFAYAAGAISIVVLVIGVAFSIIKTILRNRIR